MVTAATKVTIIAESLLEQAIITAINDAGASGYTTVEGRGKGQHGMHGKKGALLVDAFSIVKIEFVMKDRTMALEVAERIADRHFGKQPGIIYISSVEVLRAERF